MEKAIVDFKDYNNNEVVVENSFSEVSFHTFSLRGIFNNFCTFRSVRLCFARSIGSFHFFVWIIRLACDFMEFSSFRSIVLNIYR